MQPSFLRTKLLSFPERSAILVIMKIKVTVVSHWVGPREHLFDDWGNAEEFALAMRDCQYKTVVEEVLADQ